MTCYPNSNDDLLEYSHSKQSHGKYSHSKQSHSKYSHRQYRQACGTRISSSRLPRVRSAEYAWPINAVVWPHAAHLEVRWMMHRCMGG